MSEINKIKSLLVSAVDFDQKIIVKLKDVFEALKCLETFPMTFKILKKSGIGKIVNEIRHFNELKTEIKKRLKVIIKRWNVECFPSKLKNSLNPTKSSVKGSQKSIKVSESFNNVSMVDRTGFTELAKPYRSSNNLEIMNGNINNKYNNNNNNICDPISFETPIKRAKFDETCLSDSLLLTNSQQKENHYDKSIPNSIAQINSLSSVDKTRKRKHTESLSNGVVMTPIQKVKSTVELLADMGDLVGNDTKKKILCNEIALEDDIPRSCIPESVRPRTKPVKTIKPAQIIKNSNKVVKNSPKVPILFTNNIQSPKILENTTEHRYSNNYRKFSPKIDNNNRLIMEKKPLEINEKVSLKLKIAVKQKSKHIEPPITNRMDEIPQLVDIDNLDISSLNFDEYYQSDKSSEVHSGSSSVEKVEVLAKQLAYADWDGYNRTRHPIGGQLMTLVDTYVVNHLYILPWSDCVHNSRQFFPPDYGEEMARLCDSISLIQ